MIKDTSPIGRTSTATSLLQDLFQDYFRYNVDEINAYDSKDFIIKHKQKWYTLAEQDYKRSNSGTPPSNFILKSIFRNISKMRTFSEIPFRVLIIKDADGLSMDIQQALRRTLEKSSRTSRFILICENLSKKLGINIFTEILFLGILTDSGSDHSLSCSSKSFAFTLIR